VRTDDQIALIIGAHAMDTVTELWAWVGVHENGGTSLLSMDLPDFAGLATRHVPLITSKEAQAKGNMGKMAREIQRQTMHLGDRFVRIELRHFVLSQS
jgi:hypothetical protein